MSMKTLSRSFAGGEISPEMMGRIDLTQFQTGLLRAQNFIVLPHGPARARKGSQYVNKTKIDDRKVGLIEFSFNNEQSYALEFGHLYIRVHTQRATLASGGVPVEVVSPYSEDEVMDIHYVQSEDVLTLVHPNHPPQELRRTGPTTFTLTAINFVPSIAAPTGVSIAATGSGSTSYSYVVTSIASTDELEESAESTTVTTSNNLTTAGNKNTISWTANPNASRYYIYKLRNGLFGYVGETTGTSFVDDNIVPDMTRTPPISKNPFGATGEYPGAVTYFEGRRCFAGSNNKPQNFWATRSGTESNMNFSIPTRDDDSIVLRLRARKVNKIEHMIPLSDLLLLTTDGDFRIYTQNSDVFSPNTVSSRAQAYNGANNVQPVTSGESAVYIRNQSSRVHEVAYDNIAYAFKSNDISIMAPHLFDEYSMVDMALTRSPFPIIWVVRSDGVLLGVTYMPSQKVWAWHHHPFEGGEVESIAGVPEGNRDVLYLSVKREIDGQVKRYIEVLDLQQETILEEAFHVDCGLFYDGSPIINISGLDHLEGEIVNILADGETHPPQQVVGGSLTLEYEASKIAIGLPLTARLKTLPITAEIEAYAQGHVKNVNRVYLRTYQSGRVKVGPSEDRLTEFQDIMDETYGSEAALRSAILNIEILPSWDPDGGIVVENSDPTPLTVLSMVLEVAMGD